MKIYWILCVDLIMWTAGFGLPCFIWSQSNSLSVHDRHLTWFTPPPPPPPPPFFWYFVFASAVNTLLKYGHSCTYQIINIIIIIIIMTIIEVFIKCRILSIETVLSTHTHTRMHAHTHTRTHARTHAHTHTYTHRHLHTQSYWIFTA